MSKNIHSGEILLSGLSPYFSFLERIDELDIEKFEEAYFFDDDYLYVNGVRFNIEDGMIVEYNFDFYTYPSLKILFRNNKFEKVLSSRTKLHEFLLMLNENKMPYEEVKTMSVDYFILVLLDSKVHVIFDLEEGGLYKLGKYIYAEQNK